MTDDPDLAAKSVMLSGSYMFSERHGTPPPPEAFARIKYDVPNISGRMDNLRAAILRPQIRDLYRQIERWNKLYMAMEENLKRIPGVTLPRRPQHESYVGSSIQFLLLDWPNEKISNLIERCGQRGVALKWFGGAEPVGFTSRYDNWRYAPSERMPQTDRVLRGILDMRLPLTFTLKDCAIIGRIIRSEVDAVSFV